MSRRLLLVRHGESEWNALGRWQGHADPPLSDLGRRQARLAARAVGAVGAVGAVIASDLRRAAETASIIASELGAGPVIIEPGIKERDVGAWSGLTRDEIEARWPGALAERRRPAGWEADGALVARARAALGRIVREVDGADILAVTHGGLIHALERDLGAPDIRLGNLEGRWFHADGDRLSLGERVLLIGADGTPVTVPGEQ